MTLKRPTTAHNTPFLTGSPTSRTNVTHKKKTPFTIPSSPPRPPPPTRRPVRRWANKNEIQDKKYGKNKTKTKNKKQNPRNWFHHSTNPTVRPRDHLHQHFYHHLIKKDQILLRTFFHPHHTVVMHETWTASPGPHRTPNRSQTRSGVLLGRPELAHVTEGDGYLAPLPPPHLRQPAPTRRLRLQ